MKLIKSTQSKRSVKLKMFYVIFGFMIIISLITSLKFSGNSKKIFPELVYSDKLVPPDCSNPGGFYKEPFAVTLHSDPSLKIYYTLDGSEPTLASLKYSKPIIIKDVSDERNNLSAIPSSPHWLPPIDNVYKGTVLRAISIDDDNNKSKELVNSFFVNSLGREKYPLAVFSITINENDFFGYNRGIYVLGKSYANRNNYIKKNISADLPWWEYPANYLQRGADEERPAHIELFEKNNLLAFEGDVGIRINGNATRGFSQKSLRVCFREQYGLESLNYQLFPANPVRKFNSFILRNSGNDWNKTMFRDALMQSLMKNTSLDIQDYRPSIVFINGEYWGIHNIRERFDQNYLANKYNINADSITILELGGQMICGQKESEKSFKKLIEFVKSNNLAEKQNYEYLKSSIDIASFSDFVISNIYFCNNDWPNNNVRFWRSDYISDTIVENDGKWRWMLFDTDWGFGYNSLSEPKANLLKKATQVGSVGVLFGALIQNSEFKEYFLNRFQKYLNTRFYPANVIKTINSMESEIAPAIPDHIKRWRAIDSYARWLKEVEILMDFANRRPQYQVKQLNDFFSLKGDRQIVLKK